MKQRSSRQTAWIMALVLMTGLISTLENTASAESLFRAGIAYQTSQPFTPRSLFAVPRPTSVGDMVTVNIVQNTAVDVENSTTITKKRDLTENSTNIFNNVIKKVTAVKDLIPSVDGVKNQDDINVTASAKKTYSYKDSITCQVVQVLPNGSLIIQGKKSIMANQEQQDLMMSGIVNPYYLDSLNAISSDKVANLQLHVAGHGVITRQQGDGILGKYFQFFN